MITMPRGIDIPMPYFVEETIAQGYQTVLQRKKIYSKCKLRFFWHYDFEETNKDMWLSDPRLSNKIYLLQRIRIKKNNFFTVVVMG